MKKKETEFLTEEEAQAILSVPDQRILQGKRDVSEKETLHSRCLLLFPANLIDSYRNS